jgi:hypothetical protein
VDRPRIHLTLCLHILVAIIYGGTGAIFLLFRAFVVLGVELSQDVCVFDRRGRASALPSCAGTYGTIPACCSAPVFTYCMGPSRYLRTRAAARSPTGSCDPSSLPMRRAMPTCRRARLGRTGRNGGGLRSCFEDQIEVCLGGSAEAGEASRCDHFADARLAGLRSERESHFLRF